MRRLTALCSTLALVITAFVAAPGTAAPASAPTTRTSTQTAERAASGPGERLVGPGRIGKAKVGMTVAEAMATGQFRQDVPNPPCDPIALQPRKPYKNQYSVFVSDDGRIVEMNGYGSRLRTKPGARYLSTYRRLQTVYGDALSRPQEVGFAQWGVFVKVGEKGPERRWLGFLFGDALVEDGDLGRNDVVTLMGVTKGKRPALILDGC